MREKGTIGDEREIRINTLTRARKDDCTTRLEALSIGVPQVGEEEEEMATRHVRIRIHEELMDEIKWLMEKDGRNQSQTIITLIERGLQKPGEIEKNKEMPGWYQRVREREYFLKRIEERRAQIRGMRDENKNRERKLASG